MSCNFHVGQKVVCVREHDPETRAEMAAFNVAAPIKGKTYTIRKVFVVGGDLCVLLDEIVNPIYRYMCGTLTEQGFATDRFRPVVTRKTDISIFKAMLNPSKQRISA